MNYLFWYKIDVLTKFGNGDVIEKLRWDNLRFEIRNKYNWYFIYRAALLQVKYPKAWVNQVWGKTEINNNSPSREIEIRDKRRRTTLKRKITQFKNAIKKYEDEESTKLFPNLDNKRYLRTKEQLINYENELGLLE